MSAPKRHDAPRRWLDAHALRLVALAVLLLMMGACVRGCTSRRPPIHPNPNMDDQPRYEAQSASEFFANGAAMQRPVEGTVARGQLDYLENDALYTGLTAGEQAVTEIPIAVTPELLARGEERYGIYCAPCHGDRADGRGMLRERAGVQVSNLLEDRFRVYPAGQVFNVITHGFGLMAGYQYPIPPEDRWAIVAFVQRLQQEAGPMPEPEAAQPEPAQPDTAQPDTASGPSDDASDADQEAAP